MNFRINDIEIDIQLKPGVYTFYPEGAMGKTYLYKLLTRDEIQGVKTFSYMSGLSYGLNCNAASEIIDNFKGRLLYLDRFDLYCTKENVRQLEEIGKRAVVLADLKQLKYDASIKYAWLVRERVCMRVGYDV